MLQALQLFGFTPIMLEWSGNPCFQGCDYCYAKMWKRENEPIEKFVNFVLRQETKKEGLLPFLIRKRQPIAISNRTDIMCAADWRERLYAIKQMGFPVYLETKLNKDYKDLTQILDREKDIIYHSVTGYNNKYEENNLLSAEEKIEAARWLNEAGLYHILAVNPFMPDKTNPQEIIRMIEYIKPHGFVMRDYHKPASGLAKKYYMAEYPKDIMKTARDTIRAYCRKNNIDHDINGYAHDTPCYPENNLRAARNKRMLDGMGIVKEEFAINVQKEIDEMEVEAISISLESALLFWEEQIDYFKDCVIKPGDYAISISAGRKKQQGNMGIVDFIKAHWNRKWCQDIFDWCPDLDDEGNILYFRWYNGNEKYVGRKNKMEMKKGLDKKKKKA